MLCNCDKCGESVPASNDAVRLSVIAGELDSVALVTMVARHLLPTERCPGSPSRAQYLEGQPRDPRYPYVQEQEQRFRAAYAQLLIEHPLEQPDGQRGASVQ